MERLICPFPSQLFSSPMGVQQGKGVASFAQTFLLLRHNCIPWHSVACTKQIWNEADSVAINELSPGPWAYAMDI